MTTPLEACSIQAPSSAYTFKLPEMGNDYEITKVSDLEIIPTEKLTEFMDERNIAYTLDVNPKRFETHCDIQVMLVFENETDAVMFKLQWNE